MSQAGGGSVVPAGEAPDPNLGRQLGQFRVERKLGQGGMGAVYEAFATRLGRRVALKLLPAGLAAQHEFLLRFQREARRAAQFDHPNIVQVLDVDEVDGVHFIVMQLLAGGSLQDLLGRRGKLPAREAARVVRDAARGLSRAHREGVIHRDVKPANILLGEEGEVRLGDFGLVKDVAGSGGDAPLTQTGTILGTPHYMAPEQCEGLTDIDHRADLYAMGLVLYQALSGVLPAQGSTPLQIIHHRLRSDPPPLEQVCPGVPPALVSIVSALLERDRARRLSSAEELVRRLDAFLGAPGDAAEDPTEVAASVGTHADTVDLTPAASTPPAKPAPAALPALAAAGSARTAPRAPAPPPGPPPPPKAPARPARRGWSCWQIGCCLSVVLFGGTLGLLVLAGLGQEASQRLALGGVRPEGRFVVGGEVLVSARELGAPPGAPLMLAHTGTEIASARHRGGKFQIELEPFVEEGGSAELRLVLSLGGDRPTVEGYGPNGRQVLASLPDQPGQIQPAGEELLITCPFRLGDGRTGILELRFAPP